ncbi:hypothetical protein ACN47E_003359 [Coniothyrium glycines]
MLFQKLALVSALTALVAAQDINQDDIPQQCTAVCAEVVSISRRCDDQNDNDAAELNCICTAPNANTLLPTCEACVAQYDVDTDPNDSFNDNDVLEVLTRCSFSTTTFNTASASSILQSIASSFASASGTTITTTSGTSVLTTTVPASTNLPAQTVSPGNAQNVPAAVGLGALGLALGLL